MNDLLIENAWLVTYDAGQPVIEGGEVLILGGKIAAVGRGVEAPAGVARLDAGGRVTIPGLINAHHHLYSSFARGFTPPGEAAANFVEILERLWWKLDLALTPEGVRYSSLVALLEAIRTGCTTIIDHHASPGCTEGSLDILEGTFREAGLSGCLCYETSDRNREGDGVEENGRFIRKALGGDGQVTGLFGLHAQMTLGDRTLERVAAICGETGTGVHIHVAEGAADEEDCMAKHGCRVIERLDRFGLGGEGSIYVHGIHLDESEMERIAERGTMMVHNPESNMNNAVGTQQMLKLLGKGIVVGLGTDGMTGQMISSARVAHLLQRAVRGDPRVGFCEACQMLLENNARIAGRCFPEARGRLVAGELGDVVVFDYRPTTPLEEGRFYGHLLYGLNVAPVHATVARGRVLYRGGKFLTLDEEAISARGRELARETWERF